MPLPSGRQMLYPLLICLFTAFLGEGICRLADLKPHRENDYRISSEPADYIIPHHYYGFGLRDGIFNVQIRDSLSYRATHGPDSLRITSLDGPRGSTAEYWLFGCSFTYGIGIDDSSTFPWILQARYPALRIRNFGLPGAGTVHAYLQLRRALKSGGPPELVILNYSARLHDARNRMGRKQRGLWNEAFQTDEYRSAELLKNTRFPWVDYNSDSFSIRYLNAEGMYRHFPLRKQSALVNLLENSLNEYGERSGFKQQCSEFLLLQLRQLSRKHGFRLLVCGITDEAETRSRLKWCAANAIDTLYIGLDLSETGNDLRPWDGHPSAQANRHYARRIGRWLDAQNW